MQPTKHESATQPGLFYWAERNPKLRAHDAETYSVVAQASGFPATEAHDDWFHRAEDADAIARAMAAGTFEA